ncbi:hypothetical protein [Streptomyces sp. BF23-18]|uniref:hypothetical protein n=1 Tax=unclassified Streptomyces TaxID=2593676 RepID=UPI0034E54E03
MIRSNSTGGCPLAALWRRLVLQKSAIQVAVFSRASARVAVSVDVFDLEDRGE